MIFKGMTREELIKQGAIIEYPFECTGCKKRLLERGVCDECRAVNKLRAERLLNTRVESCPHCHGTGRVTVVLEPTKKEGAKK